MKSKTRKGLRLFARRVGFLVAILVALPLVLVPVYAIVQPPGSVLMVWRLAGGTWPTHNWVDFEDMGKRLPIAVMAAEDTRFCKHGGVDWSAVEIALGENRSGGPRGASTISMQTVKNLFLWPSRSYVRKGLEVPLALYADLIWSKPRMMEIYLNIAEWGDGIYGAGAAAQHHFGKAPKDLTRREAARLAASLPNPFVRIAGKPGPQTRRIARRIDRRVPATRSHAACLGLE